MTRRNRLREAHRGAVQGRMPMSCWRRNPGPIATRSTQAEREKRRRDFVASIGIDLTKFDAGLEKDDHAQEAELKSFLAEFRTKAPPAARSAAPTPAIAALRSEVLAEIRPHGAAGGRFIHLRGRQGTAEGHCRSGLDRWPDRQRLGLPGRPVPHPHHGPPSTIPTRSAGTTAVPRIRNSLPTLPSPRP